MGTYGPIQHRLKAWNALDTLAELPGASLSIVALQALEREVARLVKEHDAAFSLPSMKVHP